MEYLKPPPSYSILEAMWFFSYTSLNFPFVLFQSFDIDVLKWCFWSVLKLRQFHTWMESLIEYQKNLIPIPAMSMGQRIYQLFEMRLWCVCRLNWSASV